MLEKITNYFENIEPQIKEKFIEEMLKDYEHSYGRPLKMAANDDADGSLTKAAHYTMTLMNIQKVFGEKLQFSDFIYGSFVLSRSVYGEVYWESVIEKLKDL